MNKDQRWIGCAANDKIDMVRTVRYVTAPRRSQSYFCRLSYDSLVLPGGCVAAPPPLPWARRFGNSAARTVGASCCGRGTGHSLLGSSPTAL